MNLGDFFFDERSRPSAVLRSLIRARIYLLTGFFVAGAVCVTLAAKHSGASSVLRSLASSALPQPATEQPARTTQVAALAQPGVKLDHPPSDPTTAPAPLRALEPIGSPSQPNNDTAGASSSDRPPAKASSDRPPAKPKAVAPHSKVAKVRAKVKPARVARAARKQRNRSRPDWFGGGRQYSRGYGGYGGFGGFGGYGGGYGAGYGGGM